MKNSELWISIKFIQSLLNQLFFFRIWTTKYLFTIHLISSPKKLQSHTSARLPPDETKLSATFEASDEVFLFFDDCACFDDACVALFCKRETELIDSSL